jgi:hypothetical protein
MMKDLNHHRLKYIWTIHLCTLYTF